VLEQLCRIGEAVEAGETKQARSLLEDLLRADPTLAEGLLWLGLAHHLEGDAAAAAEALRRARCMEPELWPATLFAALNAERLGRWSKAARCWSDLDRALGSSAPPIPAPSRALAQVLPRWRAEALELVRQRRDQDRRTSSDS
jgi:tetratricopeptide (TPR) repeat protein